MTASIRAGGEKCCSEMQGGFFAVMLIEKERSNSEFNLSVL